MKVLLGAFNQEKALLRAFSVIRQLQTSRGFVSSSNVQCALVDMEQRPALTRGDADTQPVAQPDRK